MAKTILNQELFWNFWQDKEAQLRETATKYCGDKSIVDDVLHDVFSGFWKKLENNNITLDKGDIKSYVRASIYNKAMDYHRKKKELPFSNYLKEKLQKNSFEVDDIETTELLKVLLEDVSEEGEKIFRLYLMGYTHKEIAKKINITPNSAKSRVYMIKKLLKQKLGSIDYLISIFVTILSSI